MRRVRTVESHSKKTMIKMDKGSSEGEFSVLGVPLLGKFIAVCDVEQMAVDFNVLADYKVSGSE